MAPSTGARNQVEEVLDLGPFRRGEELPKLVVGVGLRLPRQLAPLAASFRSLERLCLLARGEGESTLPDGPGEEPTEDLVGALGGYRGGTPAPFAGFGARNALPDPVLMGIEPMTS
jgi:hypothetical protein